MRSLTIILVLVLGCKEHPNEHQKPEGSSRSTPRKLSVKDEEVRRILILEAALEKAKAELASLEAAEPRDEAAIISKRNAIEAVTQTLANTRRRFNEMDRRSRQHPN